MILFDIIFCHQIQSFHLHVLHKFQLGIKMARSKQFLKKRDRLNTILGSDTGLEKWKSRQATNKEWINITDNWINQRNQKANNKYLWWMMKFKQIIWRFQINLQIYNEIHEICGFTQGFNRKSIDLSTKNHGFQFYERKMKVQFKCN